MKRLCLHFIIISFPLCLLLLQGCLGQKKSPDPTSIPPSSSVQGTEGTSYEWHAFPHPPRNIWVDPNSNTPDLFHGRVVLSEGITQCVRCHGNDLKGGTAHVSCSLCHPGFPTNHRILSDGTGANNPTWAGTDASQTTHHSKLFEGRSPTHISQLAQSVCTTQCHTPLNTADSSPTGDCVGCHHTDTLAFSALNSVQAPQWAQATQSIEELNSLHHSKIFTDMTLAEKGAYVTQNCLTCHDAIASDANTPTGQCYSCHHQGKTQDGWIAFTDTQAQQWKNTRWKDISTSEDSLTAFHHRTVFADMAQTQKGQKITTDCARCHSVMSPQSTQLAGSCYTCHHTDGGSSNWQALSSAQAASWKEISSANTYSDTHHRNAFLGLSATATGTKITQCNSCHLATSESLSSCMNCHHGMSSSSDNLQTYNAFGDNIHRYARRINDTDGQFHTTHHKNLFPSDVNSAEFATLKSKCLTCHSVQPYEYGDEVGFCMACHHEGDYYNDKISRIVDPDEWPWMDLHTDIGSLIDNIPGYRKTCILCHHAKMKDPDGALLTKPDHVIQGTSSTVNCAACHRFTQDQAGNIFPD